MACQNCSLVVSCKYSGSQNFLLYNVRRLTKVWGKFSSVAQSCSTLCDPMDCSTPGLPVHHQLPEPTHTHVHPTIQPSHLLSSSSPPTSNLSQYQGLLQRVSSLPQWSKYWSFSVSISPSNECSGLISFRKWTGWIALQSKGFSRVFFNTTVQKHQFFGTQLSL